jgi:hypothetical protein
LIVYTITKRGRVEASNYRTVKLPANVELPSFVRTSFKDFYAAMFERQARAGNYKTLFTEYFWDMSWCDPCAAEPLTRAELQRAGVFWPEPGAMLTRLHLRYTRESTPEDLMLQETGDRGNFQTRYVLRNAFAVQPESCPAAPAYLERVAERQRREAQALADLTGWSLTDIGQKIAPGAFPGGAQPWWRSLWNPTSGWSPPTGTKLVATRNLGAPAP